jgi:thiamine pyrophosphokinase
VPPFILLVGGGSAPAALLQQLAPHACHIIAADGGANKLHRAGIAPHVWLGDGDSVSPAALEYCQQHGTLVQHNPCQNSTDAEKALQYIQTHWPNAAPLIVGIGFGGSRFDHTLGALHVLHKFAPLPIVLRLGNDAVRLLPRHTTLQLPVGTRVSLFPLLPVRGIASTGLAYPINGLQFAVGAQTGTSNHATATPCIIKLSRPYAMVGIIPWRYWLAWWGA